MRQNFIIAAKLLGLFLLYRAFSAAFSLIAYSVSVWNMAEVGRVAAGLYVVGNCLAIGMELGTNRGVAFSIRYAVPVPLEFGRVLG